MALGWKTAYEQTLAAEGLSNWEIFALAAKACEALEWEYLVVDENSFTATTPTHWTLSEEIITIRPENGNIIFKSQGESLELYEGGRNRKNIEGSLVPAFILQKEKINRDELRAAADQLKREIQTQLKTGRVASEKVRFGLRDHEVTLFLIIVNIVVFSLMRARGVDLYHPSAADITRWGGNVQEYVITGDWWRLVSNLFVHIGIRLLVVNIIGLYFIGIMVETILGKIKFLIAYLTTGALASLFSIYYMPHGVTAGASGAIAGLYGILIAFATTGYINKKFNTPWFVGVMAYLIFSVWFGFYNGVDNAANLGGLAAGIIIGYLFYLFHFRRNLARAGGTRISIEIMLATALLIYFYVNNNRDDSLMFEKAVMKLNQIELKAMTQMQQLQNAETTEDAANTLKKQALPLWKNFQKELDKTDKYRLNEQFNNKRTLLHRYAQLRIRQTELIYKSIAEETDKYNPAIDEMAAEIETLIDQMGD